MTAPVPGGIENDEIDGEAGEALQLAGRRVLVVGAAKTGVATANFLLGRGAVVTVTDRRDAGSLDAYLAGLHPRVELELGGHRQETFLSRDLIVPSPGIPMDDPLLPTVFFPFLWSP